MKKKTKTALGILIVIIIILLIILYQRSKMSDNSTSPDVGVPAAQVEAIPGTSEDHVTAPTLPDEVAPSQLNVKDITPEQIAEVRQNGKLQLVMAYSALKAFHAEYGRYTTDLIAAGAIFADSSEMNFKIGFISPFNAIEDPADSERVKERPNRMTSDDIIGEETDRPEWKYRYTPNAERINLGEYAGYCKAGCTANEDEFELLVAVPLGDTGKVDVWSINQKKEMTLVQDGMK